MTIMTIRIPEDVKAAFDKAFEGSFGRPASTPRRFPDPAPCGRS